MEQDKNKSFKNTIFLWIYVLLVVSVLLGFSSFFLSHWVIESKNSQMSLFSLALEYRSCLNQMTDNCRAFCLTDEQKYQKEYNHILGWWTGIRPRPDSVLIAPGDSLTTYELAKQLGSSQTELTLLHSADTLANTIIEHQQQSILSRKSLEPADLPVFSAAYDSIQDQVFNLINEYIKSVEQRSKLYEEKSATILQLAHVSIFLTLIMIPFIFIRSQQKQLHKSLDELRVSRRQTESIMETAGVGTYVFDVENQQIIPNSTLINIIGLDRNIESISIDSFLGMLPDQSAAQVQKTLSHIEEQKTVECDLELNCPDGNTRFFNCSGEVIRDDSNEVSVSGLFSDVTALRMAQHKLSNQIERLHLAANIGGIDIFEWNFKTSKIQYEPHGNLIFRSKQTIHYVNTKTYLSWIHPDDIVDFKHDLQKLYGKDTNLLETSYRIRINESDPWLLFSVTARVVSRDSDAQPRSMIGAQRDITRERNLQERLNQSQKMEAIGQLAGGIAHDFNNQLHGLLGFAELLNTTSLSSGQRHYLSMISQAGKRCADLTNQLLAFARKGWQRKLTLDVNLVIDRLIDMLNRTIDKSIRIEKQYNTETPFLSGDPAKLENALLNIALNARDAMPDGGTLTFSTDLQFLNDTELSHLDGNLESGTYVVIRVADTGTGIPVDIKEKIFEPFFTTKTVGQGTGLGLAAVYGTVKSHEGTISVESNQGNGTVFSLYFPFCDTFEDTDSDLIPQINDISHSGTLLIIDDEETNRDLLSENLKILGYQVITASDGLEGLRAYKENHGDIDCVLLDLIMPRLSGRETLNRLLSFDGQAKVIVISGHSLDENVLELLENGALDFIGKPFTMQELSTTIQCVLEQTTPPLD